MVEQMRVRVFGGPAPIESYQSRREPFRKGIVPEF
jgi:hypothetical protein